MARIADSNPAQAAQWEKEADDDSHRLLDYALDCHAAAGRYDQDLYTAADVGTAS